MRKLLLLFFVVVALAACEPELANTTIPSMANHAFRPKTIRLTAGDAVRWFNDTDEAHTVTAVEESLPEGAEYFSSGAAPDEDAAHDSLSEELIKPGEVFEWTFEQSGTYRYYCIPHRGDGMEGTIVVEE